ncbi:hypothetical protein QCN27_15775 [Cereibacter sp. SYSU M97828]|nr:hypothetical protein [Cereibacter flavus]
MAKYLNVMTPVEGTDGRTRFNNVGVAFQQREGAKSVMKIKLHSLPLDGELVLFEPKSGKDGGEVTE